MYIPSSQQTSEAVRLVARQYNYDNDRGRYIHPGGIFGLVAAGIFVLLLALFCVMRKRRSSRRAMVAGGTGPAHKWGGGWHANNNNNNNNHNNMNANKPNGGGYYNPGSAAPPPYTPPQQQAGGPTPMAPAFTATHHNGQGQNADYYSSTHPAPEVTGLSNKNNGRW
ncbi:hypothetical protein RB594_007161 [Gaeumannomyces avenae]